MLDAWSSCHHDVDIDIAPSLFLRNMTDRLKLSQYVFKDLLNCKVDCRIIVCIWTGAQGNPTKALYSNQTPSTALCQNECGIATDLWRMSGEIYHLLQGTISRSSFCDKVISGNLSESCFLHYFDTRCGWYFVQWDKPSTACDLVQRDTLLQNSYVFWEVL